MRNRRSRRTRLRPSPASAAASARGGRATAAAPRPRRRPAPAPACTRAGPRDRAGRAATRAGSRPRRTPGTRARRAGARRATDTTSGGASRADGDEPAARVHGLAAAELLGQGLGREVALVDVPPRAVLEDALLDLDRI